MRFLLPLILPFPDNSVEPSQLFSRQTPSPWGILRQRNENHPARSLQRRRPRHHHHHHGAGIESPARHRPRRPETAPARPPQLRPELHLRRHLLEQPSPPLPVHPTRQRQHPLGEPSPAFLALAFPVHHRVGRRKPSRIDTHRRLRLRPPYGRHRLLHFAMHHHQATRPRLPPRRRPRQRLERQTLPPLLPPRHPPRLRPPLDLPAPLYLRRPPLARPPPPP